MISVRRINKIDLIKKGKVTILFSLVLLSFFIITSCGSNNSFLSPSANYDPYLIDYINIHNNSFEVKTTDPVDLKFTYFNTYDNKERYIGYTTDSKTGIKTYTVPISSAGILYSMEIIVYSEVAYKDTLVYFYSQAVDDEFLRIDFVDVAQGDGALIRTPEGHAIAVDGGYGTFSPSWAPNHDWNGAGEPLMLNYVQSVGVDHFSYMIETHRHSDHWGGLADIINDGIGYDYYLSPLYALGYYRGDYLDLDSAVSFQILNIGYPPNDAGSGTNNTSIVLKVTYGSTEYILTGDAEREVEFFLVNSGYNLSANVLKVGHHGSNTSSTNVFLGSVLNQFAKIATISFGTDNPYDHPRNLVRFKNYQTFGTNIPSLSYAGSNYHFDVGTIKTFSDGNVIIVKY
ncbi:MAG: MBL fold metallo-hydrolase [Candidatus Cloacimonetes bacterium]|nr:MBL fold metallo-hydrolase [Candidatus Cloacimonadota bacterium]